MRLRPGVACAYDPGSHAPLTWSGVRVPFCRGVRMPFVGLVVFQGENGREQEQRSRRCRVAPDVYQAKEYPGYTGKLVVGTLEYLTVLLLVLALVLVLLVLVLVLLLLLLLVVVVFVVVVGSLGNLTEPFGDEGLWLR
jgi:hypothetical protein